jgi:hypothetical protein
MLLRTVELQVRASFIKVLLVFFIPYSKFCQCFAGFLFFLQKYPNPITIQIGVFVVLVHSGMLQVENALLKSHQPVSRYKI